MSLPKCNCHKPFRLRVSLVETRFYDVAQSYTYQGKKKVYVLFGRGNKSAVSVERNFVILASIRDENFDYY